MLLCVRSISLEEGRNLFKPVAANKSRDKLCRKNGDLYKLFEDEDKNDFEIFSQDNTERAQTSVILAGKI